MRKKGRLAYRIHSQGKHKKRIAGALISKSFMWIIREHGTKLTFSLYCVAYNTPGHQVLKGQIVRLFIPPFTVSPRNTTGVTVMLKGC